VTVRLSHLLDGAGTPRLSGLAGLAAVAGNLLGVAFLHDMPSAYRLARLDEWAAAVRAQPAATLASAACFAVGLVALASWAGQLGRLVDTPRARFGASAIAVTALVNAAGSLLPIAHAFGTGEGVALLRTSLTLDALFNLGLGVGLTCIGLDMLGSAKLRWLALAAGVASAPVAAQALWDPAASLLYLAAPLWLSLILATSITWLRAHAPAST
jgi:hypothetical protein